MAFREIFNTYCKADIDIWSEHTGQFSLSYNGSTVILEALTFTSFYLQILTSPLKQYKTEQQKQEFSMAFTRITTKQGRFLILVG